MTLWGRCCVLRPGDALISAMGGGMPTLGFLLCSRLPYRPALYHDPGGCGCTTSLLEEEGSSFVYYEQ